MPVVSLEMGRFAKLVGADRRRILDRLPYIGLDIESIVGDTVRVEYSPNRPDFGTDFGIAKALRGLLGIEVGLSLYETVSSHWHVTVDPRLSPVRPFIACALVTGIRLDDENVRQLISLQEDLHNGLGRRRKKVSIGLHDSKFVRPPISYRAVPRSFRFVPLDGKAEMTLDRILADSETGRIYGSILAGAKRLPILVDSGKSVLSFPPIINGTATKVTSMTTGLFVDVTSTEQKAGDDVLAILATTLSDMGGRISSVTVNSPGGTRLTPDLSPRKITLDAALINQVTGLALDDDGIKKCLRKSRLDVAGKFVLFPRYRTDIIHPVDIAEEVALGYGIDRIKPEYPPSSQAGAFDPFEEYLDRVADSMAGSGMIELMTYELSNERTLYKNFGRQSAGRLEVEGPKSLDHSILRDSLIPSLMEALSSNVKEEYPQRIFEVGRVYHVTGLKVSEEWHLCCLSAHAQVSFSEAKMYLDSFSRILTGKPTKTKSDTYWAFAAGRTASVTLAGRLVGAVGEVKPESLEAFGLGVPVCGFEVNLNALSKQLK